MACLSSSYDISLFHSIFIVKYPKYTHGMLCIGSTATLSCILLAPSITMPVVYNKYTKVWRALNIHCVGKVTDYQGLMHQTTNNSYICWTTHMF